MSQAFLFRAPGVLFHRSLCDVCHTTLLANDLMDGPKQLTLLRDMEDALNKCLIVEEFRLTEYDFPEVKVMVV